jgi:hypothetical protein
VQSKLAGCFLLLALSAGFVGCSVGVGGSSNSGQQLTQIVVTPNGAGIPVGTTQQFTATGTYANGDQKNISSHVTWAASPASLVTIDATGLATAVAPGQVSVSATLNSINGAADLTVNPPALMSISVTPLGPAIVVGATQQLTASGHYTDGSTLDVTSNAAWVSSATGVATVTSGLVATVTAGQTTITATFDSFATSTAVNVIPPATPPGLDGNYAFAFTALDSRGPQFYAGTFHANPPDASGNGTIDSGEVDANTSTGVSNNTLTGTYTIFPDGRGTLVLTPAGQPSTTYRFILAASGTTGLVIEFDGLGTAAGSFELQDPSAFNNAALAGNFVFRLTGIDGSSNPMGLVGVITTDGQVISTGSEDESDFGVQPPGFPSTVTGTIGQISSDGRVTVTTSDVTGSSNFVAYVVSANKVYLVGVDSTQVLSGVAERQANQTFSLSDLMAGHGYAYLLNRAPSTNLGLFDVIGRANSDGNGNITAGTQEEVGASAQNNITGGTYNVAANGRGTMQLTTDNGARTYIFYMVSDSRVYMLDTFTPWAGTGAADLQSDSLVNGTLSGTYALSGASVGQNDTEVSMWLNADGNKNINGIADVFANGVASSLVMTATYNVTPNGRTLVTLPNPVGVESFIFYVVSKTQADVLGSQPALDGTLLLQ